MFNNSSSHCFECFYSRNLCHPLNKLQVNQSNLVFPTRKYLEGKPFKTSWLSITPFFKSFQLRVLFDYLHSVSKSSSFILEKFPAFFSPWLVWSILTGSSSSLRIRNSQKPPTQTTIYAFRREIDASLKAIQNLNQFWSNLRMKQNIFCFQKR